MTILKSTSRWQKRLQMKREGKDRFFRGHPQSPLAAREQERFEGLEYYPLDPSYRFELELHEHDEKRTLRVEATHGGGRDLLRVGEFRFKLEGEECTLQAYKNHPGEKGLFVPFRDATSGIETYNEGRYLDLEPEIHLTGEGRWILDFNEAYNPWCAYSEGFSCPFAPRENQLNVPVRAGELGHVKQQFPVWDAAEREER
jgi:uncharacterized protein